jgi:hypothetical protein
MTLPSDHALEEVHFPPEMRFTHRRRMRLLGMRPQTLDELEATLKALARDLRATLGREEKTDDKRLLL